MFNCGCIHPKAKQEKKQKKKRVKTAILSSTMNEIKLKSIVTPRTFCERKMLSKIIYIWLFYVCILLTSQPNGKEILYFYYSLNNFVVSTKRLSTTHSHTLHRENSDGCMKIPVTHIST